MTTVTAGSITARTTSARARGETDERDARRRAALAVGGFMLLALAVRIPGLGTTNLWLDEANSWLLAKYPLGEFVANLRASPGSPLYFLLLRQWVGAFGDSERALRSLSLVVSIALIPATYALGVRTVSRRAALIGTLLVAVSPLHLYFAQEARVYMLLALLGTWCTTAYAAWRQAVVFPATASRPDGRRSHLGVALAAYVVCAILAVYTLNLAAILLVALNLDAAATAVGAVRDRRAGAETLVSPAVLRRATRHWLVAQCVVIVACLPLFLAVDAHTAVATQGWRRALGPADAGRAFLDYFASVIHGGYVYPKDFYQAVVDGLGAGAVLERALAYPLTLFAVLTALSYPPRGDRAGAARVLYFGLLIPLVIGTAVSVWRELSLPRYFLFTTPFLYLLIGAGLARMTGWLRTVLLLILLATMGAGTTIYRKVTARDSDYRPVARRLAAGARPGDTILIQPPEMGVPLSYYLRTRLPGSPAAFVGLAAGVPVAGALRPSPAAHTWVVLDYRSGAFGLTHDSLALALGGHVVSDVVETPGGSGVRVIEVDSAGTTRNR